MRTKIVASPMVQFETNQELVDALVFMSRNHYDSVCRQSSERGLTNENRGIV